MSSNPFAGIQGFWGQAETGSRIFVSYRRGDSRGDAGRFGGRQPRGIVAEVTL